VVFEWGFANCGGFSWFFDGKNVVSWWYFVVFCVVFCGAENTPTFLTIFGNLIPATLERALTYSPFIRLQLSAWIHLRSTGSLSI
jgi:hypothetical protein